jgi:hypothetical protein
VASLHELLREHLARFEPGRALRRTEQEVSVFGKYVRNSTAQRQFGTDDREVDLFAAGEGGDGVGVCRIDGHAARDTADTGVPGCSDDVRNSAFGGQLPDQGVFASAVSDDKHSRGRHVLRSKLLDIKGLKWRTNSLTGLHFCA